MRWEQGRADIEKMVGDGELERVPASRESADLLVTQARTHLESATALTDSDPPGAYQLLYDSTRKALTAMLLNQGLRPTTRGGHIAVYEAARAQLVPPMGAALRPFDRMRRRRNELEYRSFENPEPTAEDILDDLPRANTIVETADNVLDAMDPF